MRRLRSGFLSQTRKPEKTTQCAEEKEKRKKCLREIFKKIFFWMSPRNTMMMKKSLVILLIDCVLHHHHHNRDRNNNHTECYYRAFQVLPLLLLRDETRPVLLGKKFGNSLLSKIRLKKNKPCCVGMLYNPTEAKNINQKDVTFYRGSLIDLAEHFG